MRLRPQIVEENNDERELTLDELIPQYALNKTEADAYKKLCDRDNAKIKDIMLKADEKEHEAGQYVAKITISKRETMNEDILLSLLETVPHYTKLANDLGIVKVKSYVDFDALEKAIYDGKFTDAELLELGTAREVKEVVSLKVTKRKEKKD